MRLPRRPLHASRAGWNALVRRWFASRLLEVSVVEPAPWRYPWHASLRWDAVEEAWTVGVRPGWCESPTAPPSPLLEPGLVPLADGARLTVRPELWRSEGTDAVAIPGALPSPLPEAIARRGVLPPETVRQTAGGLVRQIEGLETARRDARLARAVELVLRHGRETLEPAIRAEGSEVVLAPAFRPADPAGPRLRLERAWTEAPPRPRIADVAAGLAADPGVERVRIATLWLTSPRGERPGSEPDARWSPWVQQRRRRNLAYETTGPELRSLEPLRLAAAGAGLAFLGGGAGAGAIAPLLEELDSRASEIEAAFARLRVSGEFVEV